MRPMRMMASIGAMVLAASLGSALAQEPIRIGVMFPLTGPIAAQGAPTRDAVKLAFSEANYTVAGRKIELVEADSAGRPDVGLTKVKAMVERDHVDLLLSELVSSVGAAMAPYVAEQKTPWVSVVALSGLTRGMRSPYIFRFVPSSFQYGYAPAEWAKKQGWKKVYFIGWNAPPGHESYEAVAKVFGKENVIEAMFPNVGTPDYAPYLSKIDPTKADGVFVAMWGVDAPRITQQFAEYGLAGKVPFFGIASFTSEDILGDMPPESEGVLSAYTYCGTLDTPENKAFVAAYSKAYKGLPGSYEYMGYMATKMVLQALSDVNGKVEDKDAFLAALRKVQVKGPMGVASFDDRQGMVGDFYVLKVAKGADGKLVNQCGERMSQVKDPYEQFP